ncbi:MAG: adenylate-forming enzyme, partial [Akkermansiaceae bacterium]|nr:adenylate-forming enzyme [Akkermansiaceae bacterium]
ISPWRPKLKIAFFLRANSNLYRTLGGRRIAFRYFDLLRPLADLCGELQDDQPDLLIAPATVLAELARHPSLQLRPRQIVSVAEVLDPHDSANIEAKFGVRPGNVYQATEGVLASTGAEGNLHLNEEFLHIECEWIDEERTRFHPIVTDFTRETQWIVRHRLDDILKASPLVCPCGRAARVIAAIEGRSDEVLWFGGPLFPDVLRQAFYALPDPPALYRIEQHGREIRIMLGESTPLLESQVASALMQLFQSQQLTAPEIIFIPWQPQPPAEKQRRIRCVNPLPNPA